jgi:hypothetical protein
MVDIGTSAHLSSVHLFKVYAGPYLGFYGALWDGKRVRVEPLTPLFDLTTHWRETKARSAIAASFDALMIAVESIEAHYNSIEAEDNVLNFPPKRHNCDLRKARGYPLLTSYEDNGQEMNFMYNERLHDQKLLFSAPIVNQPNPDDSLSSSRRGIRRTRITVWRLTIQRRGFGDAFEYLRIGLR